MIETSQTNQRAFERVGMRTIARALIPVDENQTAWQVCQAWTNDLSPGGACVVTSLPIAGPTCFLQIQAEGLQDKIFHCQVKRKGEHTERTFRDLSELKRYTYGLEFSGLCDDPNIAALLTAK